MMKANDEHAEIESSDLETVLSFSRINRTSSLCPICLKVINARVVQEGKVVLMEKQCEEHGYFRDVYWSDISLYKRFMSYLSDGSGIDGSRQSLEGCPLDCGLCENHKSGTLLGNIDVTNRCNLSCPVCFAEAGNISQEPTLNQIKKMMQALRDQRPVPTPAVQFSGGEPTMRVDLPEIVALSREMGFAQIQIATNGVKLAASLDLCKDLVRNGLSSVYLQFDGVTPEPYETMRGRNLLPVKLRAIDNLRSAGNLSIILVPTVAKSVNDGQLGDIVKFASKNLDVVKGVNFQPVAFTGRIDHEERMDKRITIPDLIANLENQTDGEITREDFYPVPFVAPISSLLVAETGMPQAALTAHPCCGAATYIYRFNGQMVPITRFIDVEGLMEAIKEEAQGFDGSRLGWFKMNGMILKDLPKFVDDQKIPSELNLTGLLLNIIKNGTRESLIEFHNRMLFIGMMHFQDPYNMDLERLQRCGIHYVLPDGRIIPFCSYNTVYRSRLSNKPEYKNHWEN